MLAAAHKPGAVPLRPLGLGDMYDAAFRIIRYNPQATVGSAVLVGAACMAVPVIATLILTLVVDVTFDPTATEPGAPTTGDLVALFGSYGSLALGAILQSFGLVFVTGMLAHVTAAAAVGRRMTIGEAWGATRGKRWRLVGLVVLLGLATTLIVAVYAFSWVLLVVADPPWQAYLVYGLVTLPLLLAAMCWFWVRVYLLPTPALMLEPIGVTEAIGRGFRLSRGAFWRLFGIALLTVLVTSIATQMLSFPVSLVGQIGMVVLPMQYKMLALILASALAQVLGTAFTTPFVSAVTSLQYLDQRIRKEGYDVDLMREAGIGG